MWKGEDKDGIKLGKRGDLLAGLLCARNHVDFKTYFISYVLQAWCSGSSNPSYTRQTLLVLPRCLPPNPSHRCCAPVPQSLHSMLLKAPLSLRELSLATSAALSATQVPENIPVLWLSASDLLMWGYTSLLLCLGSQNKPCCVIYVPELPTGSLWGGSHPWLASSSSVSRPRPLLPTPGSSSVTDHLQVNPHQAAFLRGVNQDN